MFILYALFSIKAWFLSILPFQLLYLVSDFFYFLIYFIFRYRKDVINENLQNAFPDFDSTERKQIAKQFYRNLGDVVVEIIKTKQIRREQLQERISFENFEIIEDLYSRKKSVIATIGHCGNWEWMPMALQMRSKYMEFAVVKPLSNKFFNDFLNGLRRRFKKDGDLIPFKQTLKTLVKHKNDLTLTIVAADQTPHKDEINFRTNFLNQDTPFFLGPEKIAKALDLAVIFIDIQRKKRGHYIATIYLITDSPKETPGQKITESYINLLEQSIRANPDNWLWSHRRWKY
ncbi:MAG: lysophospholipid acyltransferase family protein [Bacteroidales bacterium]|nr:lysophospholipid acyltransferase family protein [Bacteroidales bacterium]